ncbi:MAG TPA: hypothetical protein VGR85_15855 [Candidatus Limnocylindria bacterium]|jgi:hypothetical protein|nr:hypothetical protein [Candidatus Limnocylindria bacterium]
MRRIIATLVISLAATLGMSGLAAADGGEGDYCGASGTGCEAAFDQTRCAGAGGFGAFGKDNNFAGGANGEQTGLNNSSLCGNR